MVLAYLNRRIRPTKNDHPFLGLSVCFPSIRLSCRLNRSLCGQSACQPVSQWVSQSVSGSASQFVSQSVSDSVSQSVCPSVGQLVTDRQSVTQSNRQTECNSVVMPQLNVLFVLLQSKHIPVISLSLPFLYRQYFPSGQISLPVFPLFFTFRQNFC